MAVGNGVVVAVGVIVGVKVGLGVDVDVTVEVGEGVDVNVGPNNCPEPHAERNKLNNINNEITL